MMGPAPGSHEQREAHECQTLGEARCEVWAEQPHTAPGGLWGLILRTATLQECSPAAL